MQSIITSYLFQKGQLQIPALGTFSITDVPAISDFLHKKISAPVPKVLFQAAETATTDDALVEYIARKHTVSYEQADNLLQQWSGELRNRLQQNGEVDLPGIGLLTRQENNLHLEAAALPSAFLPDAAAERVVHPQAQHQMLVGDKETTNVEMTAYYAEETPARQRWWIAAMLLALSAMLLMLFHFSQQGYDIAALGNGIRAVPEAPPETLYQILQ